MVIVPEPNFCVLPVTACPLRPCSVVIVPEPKGRVWLLVPSDHRVMVPEPNFCVLPVTILPSRPRSVVMLPLPNGWVLLLEPSERLVIVPDPNAWVLPVRGPVMPARGGVGSAATASEGPPDPPIKSANTRESAPGIRCIDRATFQHLGLIIEWTERSSCTVQTDRYNKIAVCLSRMCVTFCKGEQRLA